MRGIIFLCVAVSFVLGKQGFGPTNQEWGYTTVREHARMFWWLHYTTASENPLDKPLIIWLQGGPGGSSTGFGNLGEIGPIDENLNDRSSAWTNHANVLFVDNPVGTGFSFAEENDGFATTNKQIAEDFLVLMKGFYKQLPDFEKVPLYIFSESYGGKMTAEIALRLYQGNQNGEIVCNITGVGLGDSWISPVDSVMTWAPYLKNLGLVNDVGYSKIMDIAQKTKNAVDSGNLLEATNLWGKTEGTVMQYAGNVDFYNILTKIKSNRLSSHQKGKIGGLFFPQAIDEDQIDKVMSKDVKKALNLETEYSAQGGAVFQFLSGDFMNPVTDIVEKLLNTTDITVAVYNGQLDLIVDTPGTNAWVDRLNFKEKNIWVKANHKNIVVNGVIEGFYQKAGRFSFYWVNRAGHMVPYDNPAAMQYILEDVTNKFKV